jgi:hypothetical protein
VKNIVKIIRILIILALLIAANIGVLYADPDFTIVLFPDTQNMVSNDPSIWEKMAQWCVDHKSTNNIQAVMGLGDVTNNNNSTQYTEALAGWNRIKNAGIPYLPLIGNHEYPGAQPRDRNGTLWDSFFGNIYFWGQTWFGTPRPNSTVNYHVKLNIGTHKYLILCLECYPRPSSVTWAQSILEQSPDREVIVATHSYLNNDGSRSLPSQTTISSLGIGDGSLGYSGSQLWDILIKQYRNIFLVVCGHQITPPTSAYSQDTGVNGNLVHQLFCNHQYEANGGNGYLMLLKFRPSLGKIEVTSYSPTLNAYDSSGAYTLTVKNRTAMINGILKLLLEN